MAALVASPEYAAAVNSYSNEYVNGAALQRPGSVGFALWLLYSLHLEENGIPPSPKTAMALAKDHGLNTTSAVNALRKWSAYYCLRPPLSGTDAVVPVSRRSISSNGGSPRSLRIAILRELANDPNFTVQSANNIAKRYIPMVKMIIPAAKVRQGDLLLYTTSMKVRDLMSEGFYSVEALDPEDTESKGYQRLLNRARARKLADYVLKGQDSNDAFLPTSVFLATDKKINFNEDNNTLEIDSSLTGAFSVVDGQHRLEGLRMAMEKDDRVLDFEVPVNIAVSLPKLAQMCHFLIVNTTQKSVDKSVEQRILARLTAALDVEDDLPSLPKWILNTVQKGEVDKAVKYVDYLNETPDSPWYKKIHMANAETDKASVNQHSFVKAIVKYILTANNPLSIVGDFEKEKKIFLNYWIAISNILDDGNSTTLYKYNGVELFCKFSTPFFTKLQDKGSFTVASMNSLLGKLLENIEGEYAGVSHPDWWKKGGQGSGLNAGALNQVCHSMTKALHATSMNSTIEI